MKPMTRRSRGGIQLNHENRIQTLERRISDDYPKMYSIILGGLSGKTGPGSYDLGWLFGDDCGGPDVECEDSFATSGNYLMLPTGFEDPFEIYMQVALSSGTVTNYLTPVTPGNLTPSDDVYLSVVSEIWRDNAAFTSTANSIFLTQGQEPPMRNSAGYSRVWWYHRIMGGSANLDSARDRYALRPRLKLGAVGPVSFEGLVFAVKLLPPGQPQQSGWSG